MWKQLNQVENSTHVLLSWHPTSLVRRSDAGRLQTVRSDATARSDTPARLPTVQSRAGTLASPDAGRLPTARYRLTPKPMNLIEIENYCFRIENYFSSRKVYVHASRVALS